MKYNRPRRGRFRNNDKGFRRNGSHEMRINGIGSVSSNFQKRSFGRNPPKAEKLLEKYNDLAKEALSNGDKILSESYYQHADHFLRVIEYRNSIQNNSKINSNNSSIEQNSDDKIILEDKKSTTSEPPENNEKI